MYGHREWLEKLGIKGSNCGIRRVSEARNEGLAAFELLMFGSGGVAETRRDWWPRLGWTWCVSNPCPSRQTVVVACGLVPLYSGQHGRGTAARSCEDSPIAVPSPLVLARHPVQLLAERLLRGDNRSVLAQLDLKLSLLVLSTADMLYTHAVRAHTVPLALHIHECGLVVPPKLVHQIPHDDGRRRRDSACVVSQLNRQRLNSLLQCTRTAPPQSMASSMNSRVRETGR